MSNIRTLNYIQKFIPKISCDNTHDNEDNIHDKLCQLKFKI